MTQEKPGAFFTLRILIRLVLTALSLAGVPQARSADGVSPGAISNNHNLMSGGGG